MVKLGDVQRFTMWLCGSIAAFGCIATLIAYAMYNNKETAYCPDDNQANCKNTSSTASEAENKILKLVSPISIAVGLLSIVGIRCWQQASNERAVQTAELPGVGQNNTAYQGHEIDIGAPPSYNDALGMDVILEAHGSFPSEPPPKYEEIQRFEEEQSTSRDEEGGGQSNQEMEQRGSQDISSTGDNVSIRTEANLPPQNEDDNGDTPECDIPNVEQLPRNNDELNDENGQNIDLGQQNEAAEISDSTLGISQGRETRIFVQQRDSNLSANELDDSNCGYAPYQNPSRELNVQQTNNGTSATSLVSGQCSNSEIGPLSVDGRHSSVNSDTTISHLDRTVSEADWSDREEAQEYSGVFYV
ncbi:uncharacterized protein LOC135687954 [Rhopilema esculentum]|uniref:uncharacterized protein LOC135687954 n=1 Tax=Rhopilema esculentum TaxID=499914 RepID=UPI0031D08E93|eukprot:gene7063-12701_t